MVQSSFSFAVTALAVAAMLSTSVAAPITLTIHTCDVTNAGSSNNDYSFSFPESPTTPNVQVGFTPTRGVVHTQVLDAPTGSSAIVLNADNGNAWCIDRFEVDGAVIGVGEYWLDSSCSTSNCAASVKIPILFEEVTFTAETSTVFDAESVAKATVTARMSGLEDIGFFNKEMDFDKPAGGISTFTLGRPLGTKPEVYMFMTNDDAWCLTLSVNGTILKSEFCLEDHKFGTVVIDGEWYKGITIQLPPVADYSLAPNVDVYLQACNDQYADSNRQFYFTFPNFAGATPFPLPFVFVDRGRYLVNVELPGTIAETEVLSLAAPDDEALCLTVVSVDTRDGEGLKPVLSTPEMWLDLPCTRTSNCYEEGQIPIYIEPKDYTFETCTYADSNSDDDVSLLMDSTNPFCKFTISGSANRQDGASLDVVGLYKPVNAGFFALDTTANNAWCVADAQVDGVSAITPFWLDKPCDNNNLYGAGQPVQVCSSTQEIPYPPDPTAEPSAAPTTEPSSAPTTDPSAQPSAEPSVSPSAQPSADFTAGPTAAPSLDPTAVPTAQPSAAPSAAPTIDSTDEVVMVASGLGFDSRFYYTYEIALGAVKSPILQYRNRDGSLSHSIGQASVVNYANGGSTYAITGGDLCPDVGPRTGMLTTACAPSGPTVATTTEPTKCYYEVLLSGPMFCA